MHMMSMFEISVECHLLVTCCAGEYEQAILHGRLYWCMWELVPYHAKRLINGYPLKAGCVLGGARSCAWPEVEQPRRPIIADCNRVDIHHFHLQQASLSLLFLLQPRG